jgi:uncharacterized repeat protein (TIGR01451 family)
MSFRRLNLSNYALAVFLLNGCMLQDGKSGSRGGTVARTPRPQSQIASLREYGPSATTFDKEGIKWVRGSMAFPTGRPESSGLLVEKTFPAEVLIGQPLEYTYKVSNLLDFPIQMVDLMDRVNGNFNPGDADPKPSIIRDGIATWQLGTLGARESKTVHVKGSAGQEGSITTCGWATYSPILCEEIRIVKADMRLMAIAPADALICETIPMTLSVKNTGSSTLTAVKVIAGLPEGLSSDRHNSVSFDAGILTPGQAREFKLNVTAAHTGKFLITAKSSTAQGLVTDASATTTVHQPILTIACKAPDERFAGRPFDVCYSIANKSDAISGGTTLEIPIPGGLSFKSASAGGRARAGSVVWDLGSVAPNSSKDFCATFVSANAGDITFNGTARSACAQSVTAVCQTRVVGVAAILLEKADDPDPIGIGETTTYTVKITNQGTADDTNVRTVITFPPELAPVSATGGGVIDAQAVTFPVVAHLAPKEVITYKVVAKGVKAGDGRTRFVLTSNILKTPVTAEESTHVY